MNIGQRLKRPPWRTILLLLAIFGIVGLAYLAWSPGMSIHDGRHDRRQNAIWLQHGWLGHDAWFARNRRDKSAFRSGQKIQELADLLARHGVTYVYPHLCPCAPAGRIARADPAQAERFLDHFANFAVLPWIGGVLDVHCSPESPPWRAHFVSSVVDLLSSHPRLAGVHLNIEPMPTGNQHFLELLDELHQAIPDGKILSVAGYPPPTRWHRFPDVHWDEPYFRQVAQRVDQLACMMYDTSIKLPKLYQHVMSAWTANVITWSDGTQVLLGLPAYDDAGTGYHHPKIENLRNALKGIHAGLSDFPTLPDNYAGIAVYCEWEMDPQEWNYLQKEFGRSP